MDLSETREGETEEKLEGEEEHSLHNGWGRKHLQANI